jgi:hypothetical protein
MKHQHSKLLCTEMTINNRKEYAMPKTLASLVSLIIFISILTACAQPAPIVWHTYNFDSLMTLQYPDEWNCEWDPESEVVVCIIKESEFPIFRLWSIPSSYAVDSTTFQAIIDSSLTEESAPSGQMEQIVIDGGTAFRQCLAPPPSNNSDGTSLPFCIVLAGRETPYVMTYPQLYPDGRGLLSESSTIIDEVLSKIKFESLVGSGTGDATAQAAMSEEGEQEVLPSSNSTEIATTESGGDKPENEKVPPFARGLNIVYSNYLYSNPSSRTELDILFETYHLPPKIEDSDDAGTVVRISEFVEIDQESNILTYRITYPTYNIYSDAKIRFDFANRALLEETFPERWLIKYEYNEDHSEMHGVPASVTIYTYTPATMSYDRILNTYILVETKINFLVYQDQNGVNLELPTSYFMVVPGY